MSHICTYKVKYEKMLRFVLIFSLILCPLVICKRRQHKEKDSSESAGDFGGKLVSDLRDDANIDLSADEEYEDLRAELLAYHTALASLTSNRRSMKATPCWQLGGICIDRKMCEGHRSTTEVAGCRDKLEVCCFNWNNFQVRDMTDKGIPAPMPWSQSRVFGGKGILDLPSPDENLKKNKNKGKSKVIRMDENENNYADSYNEKEERDKSKENPPLLVILRRKKKT